MRGEVVWTGRLGGNRGRGWEAIAEEAGRQSRKRQGGNRRGWEAKGGSAVERQGGNRGWEAKGGSAVVRQGGNRGEAGSLRCNRGLSYPTDGLNKFH